MDDQGGTISATAVGLIWKLHMEILSRNKNMSLMKWTREDYGTNVEVCDNQHRELFNRVNALNDAVSAGVRTDIRAICCGFSA